jgi:hypothetical protein
MRLTRKTIALLLLTGLCAAQPFPSDGEPVAKSKTHHVSKKDRAKAEPTATAEDIRQLKELIQAQQEQINQLRQQAAQRDQQTQQSLTTAQQTAAAAQDKAAATATAVADANAKVDTVQSDVAGLKTTVSNTVVAVQKDEKRVGDLEVPAYVHYKGINLTPGGYAQFATIYRTHNANSDTPDNYGVFPLSGSANSKVDEFRASGRASRLWLKAEGAANGMKFLGYFESDFLGTTPNASESQTSSFAPRLRLAFGNVDLPGGWSVAGGQNWSLLQTTRRGIDPLSEWVPSLIDNSYTTGFSYARQGSIRVVKSINKQTWIGVAAENPETVSNTQCITVGATPANCNASVTAGANGLQNSTLTGAPTSSTFAATATPSNDKAPDLVAKLAFEPGWGHYEVKAVGRFFRDRVYPNINATGTPAPTAAALTAGANNKVTEGGGLGFGAILPVVPRKLDVIVQGLGGKGIGRYGVTGGPDVTVRTDGSLVPIKALQTVIGFEAHPTQKLDIDIYGGDEYYGRTTYTASSLFGKAGNAILGYGAPQFVDSGCNTEASTIGVANALPCQSSAQNRNVWTIQPALWYRLFRGREGTVQFGASYSYTYRRTWDGVGATAGGIVRPLAIENIVMTSFRYYLP